MKRFYCTICKRVKRVRKYPASVVNSHNETVALRRGTCKWHDSLQSLRMGENLSTRAQFDKFAGVGETHKITRAKRG